MARGGSASGQKPAVIGVESVQTDDGMELGQESLAAAELSVQDMEDFDTF